MSISNIPNNLPAVERLVQRAAAAERSQQKEIRITVQEVHELTAELSIITSKLGKTISEIHAMLSEIKSSGVNSSNILSNFDGGGF